MNALAHALDGLLNGKAKGVERKLGFFLAVFEFGEPHPGQRFNYISNADMLDVRATLADILARLEARAMAGGHA